MTMTRHLYGSEIWKLI